MPERYEVDPARLHHGRWSVEFNKRVGEGDIAASYSGDTIGLRSTVRRPFVFRGDIWVSVGLSGGSARAYRLVPIDDFNEAASDPGDKPRDHEAARSHPLGYYHGVTVSHRKDWFEMCGTPANFVPGQPVQLGLFEDLSK